MQTAVGWCSRHGPVPEQVSECELRRRVPWVFKGESAGTSQHTVAKLNGWVVLSSSSFRKDMAKKR